MYKLILSQFAVFFSLITANTALAMNAVYAQTEKQLSPSRIFTTASSSWPGRDSSNTINKSQLEIWLHGNDGSAEGMWHTQYGGDGYTNPHPETIPGPAWIKFSFDQPYSLGKLWIWNHNQENLTDRGLKRVYVQYSIDNSNWSLLTQNDVNYFTIPQASGNSGEPHHDEIDFNGAKAKYVVITASATQGNYGSDYYGLSEVRFGIDGTSMLDYCPDGDLDSDCIVGLSDLIVLSEQWLQESKFNLSNAPSVNLYDFAVLADNWKNNNRAEAVTKFIQDNFYDPANHLYYRYFPRQQNDYSYVWDIIVQLTVLEQGMIHAPAAYTQIFEDVYSNLNAYYWDQHRIPSAYQPYFYDSAAGDDRYYDDNGWAALDMLSVYDITGNPEYLQKAKDIFDFCITGWDSENIAGKNGGIFWHVSRNTIPDKSFLGVSSNASCAYAALLLAQQTTGSESSFYINWANAMIDWTNAYLQDTDHLYFDAWDTWEGDLHPYKWTYNTAMMIRCLLLRHQITSTTADLTAAWQIGIAANAFIDSQTNAYRDPFFFSHLMGEADLELYDEFHDLSPEFLDRAKNTAEYYWQTFLEKGPQDSLGTNLDLKDLKSFSGAARLFWLLKNYE